MIKGRGAYPSYCNFRVAIHLTKNSEIFQKRGQMVEKFPKFLDADVIFSFVISYQQVWSTEKPKTNNPWYCFIQPRFLILFPRNNFQLFLVTAVGLGFVTRVTAGLLSPAFQSLNTLNTLYLPFSVLINFRDNLSENLKIFGEAKDSST